MSLLKRLTGLLSFSSCALIFAATPPSPILVSSYQLYGAGDTHSLAVSGNTVCIGIRDTVFLFDANDPKALKQQSAIVLGGTVRGLVVDGKQLLATSNGTSNATLFVIDVSNWSKPTILGKLVLPGLTGNQRPMAISGNYALVGGDALWIVDVSKAGSPAMAGSVASGYPISSLAVQGTLAFAGQSGNNEVLGSFDWGDPRHPRFLQALNIGKAIRGEVIAVRGSYAYLGIYDPNNVNNLGILDISKASAMRLLRTFTLGNRVWGLALAGSYAFAGLQNSGSGLDVIDIASTDAAVYLTGADLLGASVVDIEVSGSYAYAALWGNARGNLQVFDVSAYTQPDRTPPQISITSPAPGSILSGAMTFSASAKDNLRVASVQYRLDGKSIGSPVLVASLTAPYSLTFDTRTVGDGSHRLTAVATDNAGNCAESTPVSVTVSNKAPDAIPPAITMALPAAGTTVSYTILVSACASDNFGLKQVQFFVDGRAIGTAVTKPPYQIGWDSTTVVNGGHTLSAVATDLSGLQAASSVNVTVDNSNRWFTSFSAIRQRWVSPAGNGAGTSAAAPMNLPAAIASAVPGDLIWLAGGVYTPGNVSLGPAGTASHPIVYRGLPGQRATLAANVTLGAYTWLWGVEVADTAAQASSVILNGDGSRLINCAVHDGAGVSAFNTGRGQVIYGNVLYTGTETPLRQRGHQLYTQNQFSVNGYKYIVGNVITAGPKNACNLTTGAAGTITAQDCYGLHAYTESGSTQGLVVYYNIFPLSRNLIGGYGFPNDRHVVTSNAFYNAQFQLGYARPTQAEVRGNYFGGTGVSHQWLWGAQEITATELAPNVFSNNQVYLNGAQISVRTSAYTASGRLEGIPPLLPSDLFDQNVYNSPASLQLYANGLSSTSSSLTDWNSKSAADGDGLDAGSSLAAGPPAPMVLVYPNEYEAGRAYVAVYNWSHVAAVKVSLGALIPANTTFHVRPAADPYGQDLVTGTYSGGAITIPTNGSEFVAVLVTADGQPVLTR